MITRSVYEQMELTSDDWFVDAEIMINILNNLRYKVVHVMSGAEAESATQSKDFDVVLVEYLILIEIEVILVCLLGC